MKKIISAICSSAFLVGCLSSNENPSQGMGSSEAGSKVTENQIEYLVSQGYDRADIEIRGNGVVLEGDIYIPLEEIGKKRALRKAAQRIDNNRVTTPRVSNIRVQIDASLSAYTSAIQNAVNRWNHIDSRLKMTIVTQNPNITIYADDATSCPTSHRNLSSSTAGLAGFPTTDGRPSPTISLNLNTTFPSDMNMAKWEMVVVHELGHTFGLHHTNSSGGSHLAGTPTSDGPSIMNSGSGNTAVPNVTGISYWDARTVRMIYPENTGDIEAIFKNPTGSRTEAHTISRASNFQSYLWQTATILGPTNGNWDFVKGDYNKDGFLDIYAIFKTGANNKTEVHILNGADHFQSYLWQTTTILGTTNGNWDFTLGDFNNDAFLDIYAIHKTGANNKTEVHVLSGANNFQSYLWQTTTILGTTDANWEFVVGDYNIDGFSDIYAIYRTGANNKTEVHVLNGANNFQGWLTQTTTALWTTNSSYDFTAADYNNDGLTDIYAIYRTGANNKTEAHVLNGANNFQSWLTQVTTVLGTTNSNWVFR